ncbi:MAG: hypothetical protein Q9169_008658 [Polycauliona sp. 2 TL-2023]
MLRLAATIKQHENGDNGFRKRPLSSMKDDVAATAQGYLKFFHKEKLAPAMEGLGEDVRRLLGDPRTPNYELLLRIVPAPTSPTNPSTTTTAANPKLLFLAVIVLMNCQSEGTIKLRSPDAKEAPLIDLNLLDHPYDMQVAVQAIKETVGFLRGNGVIGVEEEKMALGPGDEEEDADLECEEQ